MGLLCLGWIAVIVPAILVETEVYKTNIFGFWNLILQISRKTCWWLKGCRISFSFHLQRLPGRCCNWNSMSWNSATLCAGWRWRQLLLLSFHCIMVVCAPKYGLVSWYQKCIIQRQIQVLSLQAWGLLIDSFLKGDSSNKKSWKLTEIGPGEV